MVVAYGSSNTTGANDTLATSIAVPVPSGVLAGHHVYVSMEMWEAANPTVTMPSGFVLLGEVVSGPQKLKVFVKEATGADSGTYTFTWSGTQWVIGHSVRVTGGKAGTNPTGTNYNGAASASGTAIPSTSVTVGFVPGLLQFSCNENGATQTTPPTGFTEVQDSNYLHSNHRMDASTSGTFTAPSGVMSASTLILAMLVAVEPAAGGPTAQSGSDTAAVADSSALARTSSLTDAAVHADASAVQRASTVGDSAAVTDSASTAAASMVSDTAAVSDGAGVARASAVVDAAALTDSATLAASLVVTDSAAVTDTSALNTGSGVQAGSDVASLADGAAITAVSTVVTDTGASAEAAGVAAAGGSGDGGNHADVADVQAVVAVTDAASLSESVTVLVIIAASDTHSTAETSSSSAGVFDAEGFVVTDGAGLGALVSAADTAALSELAAVLDLSSLPETPPTRVLAVPARQSSFVVPERPGTFMVPVWPRAWEVP